MNQEWITTMRVNLLPNGPNQPFYNVLVQDGTCRYAAQGRALKRISVNKLVGSVERESSQNSQKCQRTVCLQLTV